MVASLCLGRPQPPFCGRPGARPKGRRRRAPAGDGRGVPPGVRPGGGETQGKAGSVSGTVKYVTVNDPVSPPLWSSHHPASLTCTKSSSRWTTSRMVVTWRLPSPVLTSIRRCSRSRGRALVSPRQCAPQVSSGRRQGRNPEIGSAGGSSVGWGGSGARAAGGRRAAATWRPVRSRSRR